MCEHIFTSSASFCSLSTLAHYTNRFDKRHGILYHRLLSNEMSWSRWVCYLTGQLATVAFTPAGAALSCCSIGLQEPHFAYAAGDQSATVLPCSWPRPSTTTLECMGLRIDISSLQAFETTPFGQAIADAPVSTCFSAQKRVKESDEQHDCLDKFLFGTNGTSFTYCMHIHIHTKTPHSQNPGVHDRCVASYWSIRPLTSEWHLILERLAN